MFAIREIQLSVMGYGLIAIGGSEHLCW